MAADDILIRIEGNDAEFRASMKAAENILRDSTRKMQQSLNSVDKSFATVLKGASALKGALAFTGLTVGFDQIRKSIESVGAIAETADKIGLTAEQLQELNFAAMQNASTSEAMTQGMTKFAQSVGEARAGTGEFKDTVKQYGIQLTDANGKTRSLYDILLDLSDVMAKVKDPAERARIATDAFGRAGRDLVTVLSLGRDGFAEFAQKARDLGYVLDNDTAKKAQEINDRFNALADTIGNKLKKAIVEAADALDRFLTGRSSFAWGDDLEKVRARIAEIRAEIAALGNVSGFDVAGQRKLGKLRDEISELERMDAPATLARIQAEIAKLESDGATTGKARGKRTARDEELAQLIVREQLLKDAIAARQKQEAKDAAPAEIAAPIDKDVESKAKKIASVIQSLQLDYANLGRSARDAFVATQLDRAGVDAASEQGQAIRDLAGAYYDAKQAAEELDKEIEQQTKREIEQEDARLGIDKYISDLHRQNEILKQNRDVQAGLAAVAEQEQKAREAGIELTNQQREAIRGLTDENAKLKERQDQLKSLSNDLGSAIGTAFEDAVLEGKKFSDVLKAIEKDILRIVLRMTVTKGMESVVGGALSGIAGAFGFADGGVMTKAGPLPLKKYANGGVANTPQVAVFGEGRMNEAYVPLPDGRSIPVTVSGGASAVSYSPTIQIDARNSTLTHGEMKQIVVAAVNQSVTTIRRIQKQKGSARL